MPSQSVTATNTPTVALTKARGYSRSLSVTNTPTVAFGKNKALKKTLSVVRTMTVALGKTKTTAKALAVVKSVTVAMVRNVGKPMAVTSTPTVANFKKAIKQHFGIVSTPIVALNNPANFKRTLAATNTATVGLVKNVGKRISKVITPTIALAKGKFVHIALAVSVVPIVALSKTWLGALWLRITTLYPTLDIFKNDNDEGE